MDRSEHDDMDWMNIYNKYLDVIGLKRGIVDDIDSEYSM